jgi:HEXXH motif-containing protein
VIERHRMPVRSFDRIAGGDADPIGLAVLAAGEVSHRYHLFRLVVERCPAPPLVELLTEAQRRSRPRFEAVLTYPHVGAALLRCLRGLRAGNAEAANRFLPVLAATAGFRCGLDFSLEVADAGVVHLPGLGTARLEPRTNPVPVTADGDAWRVGDLEIPAAGDNGGPAPGWTPVRRLCHDTDSWRPVLDDLDPDRGAGGLSAAPPLPEHQFTTWRDRFSVAWARLTKHHAGWAGQIGDIVRTVTPLEQQWPGQGRSASTAQAFGAVGSTLPDDPLRLAATLVHEAQHSKLNALSALFDLVDPADRSRHYSPWRSDPRPVSGMLHGSFAFAGVAEFWAGERAVDGGNPWADYEFARIVGQLNRALETLSEATGLTADGRHLVDVLSAHVGGMSTGSVRRPARDLAGLAVDDHYLTWRLRSVVPDPARVAALTAAWRDGRRPDAPAGTDDLISSEDTFVPNERLRMWGRVAGGAGDRATGADRLLVEGSAPRAAEAYAGQVAAAPEDPTVWAGLALAAARLDDPAGAIWRAGPELVRAVYTAVRRSGDEPPDPRELAGWLATGQTG